MTGLPCQTQNQHFVERRVRHGNQKHARFQARIGLDRICTRGAHVFLAAILSPVDWNKHFHRRIKDIVVKDGMLTT